MIFKINWLNQLSTLYIFQIASLAIFGKFFKKNPTICMAYLGDAGNKILYRIWSINNSLNCNWMLNFRSYVMHSHTARPSKLSRAEPIQPTPSTLNSLSNSWNVSSSWDTFTKAYTKTERVFMATTAVDLYLTERGRQCFNVIDMGDLYVLGTAIT